MKSLWAWVRILKTGFNKGCFFLLNVFQHMYFFYIFNNNKYLENNNKYKTKITYLTVIFIQSQNSIKEVLQHVRLLNDDFI